MDEIKREKAREATRRWREANRERANELARANQKKWREANPKLHRARAKAYKAKNPERVKKVMAQWCRDNRSHLNEYARRKHYEKAYGITIEERDTMLVAQGGTCKICQGVEHAKRGWAVDHCHKTGKVRGILCQACNIVLGHAHDDPWILRRMIEYLNEYKL